MAETTKIEWADSTANLWIGCTKVSPACDHCYAEADFADRKGRVTWGPHGDRSYCKAGWSLIRKLQRAAAGNNGVDPELGRKRRIFVNSLSDFFDNHRSIVWRDDAWALIRECTDLIFMLVTKRPQNIAKMLPQFWDEIAGRVWLITTVENQEEAERRIPALLGVAQDHLRPAVFGLSSEPLLGPVDLQPWLEWGDCTKEMSDGSTWGCIGCDAYCPECPAVKAVYVVEEGPADAHGVPTWMTHNRVTIDWIIVGGESGRNARPSHPDWFRSLRDQCAAAGTPFLFKQHGEWREWDDGSGNPEPEEVDNGSEYADAVYASAARPMFIARDGRVFKRSGLPEEVPCRLVERVGKKVAGRLLDGVEHNGFPA